jgi:extradiol dioxygenase family protein
MFKKVAFTYYPVTDVSRARKFYEETLGLKSGSAGNQEDNWWVEYDLPGGGCLALTNFTKEKRRRHDRVRGRGPRSPYD